MHLSIQAELAIASTVPKASMIPMTEVVLVRSAAAGIMDMDMFE